MRVCVYNKNKNRKRSWEELENISNKILTIENMINLENIMNTEIEITVMKYEKKMETFVNGAWGHPILQRCDVHTKQICNDPLDIEYAWKLTHRIPS